MFDDFINTALKSAATDVRNQIALIAAREMRPMAHECLYLLNSAVNRYLDEHRLKYCKKQGKLLTYEEYQDWQREEQANNIPF